MNEKLKIALCLAGILVLVYLVHNYNKTQESFQNNDQFMEYSASPSTEEQESGNDMYNEDVAMPVQSEDKEPVVASMSDPSNNEMYASISSESSESPFGLDKNQVPADCYPKDQLSPSDLLPQDPNSTWAQVNPSGQGDLKDQNFLNAGYHVGVNTVGQTMRNANLQLRSEPPNPQLKVSPWQQSTIEPDSNRRAMEIGGCE